MYITTKKIIILFCLVLFLIAIPLTIYWVKSSKVTTQLDHLRISTDNDKDHTVVGPSVDNLLDVEDNITDSSENNDIDDDNDDDQNNFSADEIDTNKKALVESISEPSTYLEYLAKFKLVPRNRYKIHLFPKALNIGNKRDKIFNKIKFNTKKYMTNIKIVFFDKYIEELSDPSVHNESQKIKIEINTIYSETDAAGKESRYGGSFIVNDKPLIKKLDSRLNITNIELKKKENTYEIKCLDKTISFPRGNKLFVLRSLVIHSQNTDNPIIINIV